MRGFATLAGIDAIVRGMLVSVFPLAIYKALQDTGAVSAAYFFIGTASLLIGLLVPCLIGYVPRRWVYLTGGAMFVAGSLVTITGTPATPVAGLCLTTFATVMTFVCFNA